MAILRDTYLRYLTDTIDQQQHKTKQHVDTSRALLSNNRNASGFSAKLKELIFTQQIQSAEGGYVTDLNGNQLLDITMGFGVHLFGHKVTWLEQAMQNQLEAGYALGPLYPHTAQVAELLHNMTGLPRFAFYNSGTEAVMVAMRLARAVSGKNHIVIFEGAYHGTHETVLVHRHQKTTHIARSDVPGVPQAFLDYTYQCHYGDPASIDFIAEHADNIAAVLIEPVQSRHPKRCSPEFLQQLRNVTQEQNIALVFDEVITGFRAHNGGAAQLFGIQPDMATYGKVLGGGLPIGVVGGHDRYLDYVDGGQWQFGDDSAPTSKTTFVAGTFCHHPLSMATAKATLEHLQTQDGQVQRELTARTQAFCDELNQFFTEQQLNIRLTHFASLFRFLLKGHARLLFYALLKQGVYVWEGRNCFFATAHSDQDIAKLKQTIQHCCYELLAADILFRQPQNETSAQLIQAGFVHTAITLGAALNPEWLTLAARYVVNHVATINAWPFAQSLQIIQHDYADDLNAAIDDALHSHDNHTVLNLAILTNAKQTQTLYLAANRAYCDGWSLTMLAAEIDKAYQAIAQHQPLPRCRLQAHSDFAQWLPSTSRPATPVAATHTTHCLFAELTYQPTANGTLFTDLLSQFAETLPNKEPIHVPVAGQLLARKLRAIGHCGIHLPIEDQQSINEQLAEAKTTFAQHYSQTKPNGHHDNPHWLFNLDVMPKLPFAQQQAHLQPFIEKVGWYPLMCNVTQLANNQLLIMYKYSTEHFSTKQAQQMLDAYVAKLQ